MATSKELQAQLDSLTKQVEQARKVEIAEAVEKVRALVKEHNLSLDDVGVRTFSKGRAVPGGKTVNPPKYQDPKTGNTWTGVGKPPKWIAAAVKAGRREDFLIGNGTGEHDATAKAPAKKATAKKAPAKKAAAKKAPAAKKASAKKTPE